MKNLVDFEVPESTKEHYKGIYGKEVKQIEGVMSDLVRKNDVVGLMWFTACFRDVIVGGYEAFEAAQRPIGTKGFIGKPGRA